MKTLIFLTIVLCLFIHLTTYSQQEGLEVEGAITMGNSDNANPKPGTVKWNGSDFLGWNGFQWVSLTTGIKYFGEVTDVDGNTYQTVLIGGQEWMSQNLRTSRYRDSTLIPEVTDAAEWIGLSTGARCWYENDSSTFEIPYGKLYNWFAVDNAKGLCPTGWHVPSHVEWESLEDTLGSATVSGGHLKEVGFNHWAPNNEGATNSTGFTALPGGFRHFSDGSFMAIGEKGTWYANDNVSATNSLGRNLDYDVPNTDVSLANKKFGLSVRCIKD